MRSHALRGIVLCIGVLAASPAFAGVNTWTSAGPEGGKVNGFAADPVTAGTAYAATGGGVFKTTDGGNTWTGLANGLPRERGDAVAVDPHDPTHVVAGNFLGLYGSTDAGLTWSPLRLGIEPTAIAFDPFTPGVLYYGTHNDGTFKSTDGGAHSSPADTGLSTVETNTIVADPATPLTLYLANGDGVFRTTDGGATWTSASAGLPSTAASDLAIDPDTPDVLYVAVTSNLAYKTTDGGATWAPVGAGLSGLTWTVDVDPTAPSTVYAGGSQGVFKSTDGGATWADADAGLEFNKVNDVMVDPGDPSHLIAALDDFGAYTSDDGGLSWTEGNAGLYATNIQEVDINPVTSSLLYATGGARNGLFGTTDGAASWTRFRDPPLGRRIIQTTAVAPGNPSHVYVSANLLYKTTDGGATWTEITDGLQTALGIGHIKPPNVKALAVDTQDPETVYAETGNWGLAKSTDGGITWTHIDAGPAAALGVAHTNGIGLAVDPSDPANVYLGTFDGMARSADGGATWSYVDVNPAYSGLTVTHITFSPSTPTTIYLRVTEIAPKGGLYRTTDGGATWTLMAGVSTGPIAVDPVDPDTVYFGAVRNLRKSTDGGATFTILSEGLTDAASEYVNDVVVDPQDPRVLYIGTQDAGVFEYTQVVDVADAGPDQVAECTGGGTATVMLDGSGTADPGGTLSYTWTGSFAGGVVTGVSPSVTLGLGTHTITLTVDDGAGNTDTDTVDVTVQDTAPPTVDAGPDTTVEATGPGGAPYDVAAHVSANDTCCPPGVSVAGLSLYPLGDTVVDVTATDCAGLQAMDAVTVSVVDTTPPALTVPADAVVEAPGDPSPASTGEATATDLVDPAPAVTYADATAPGTGQVIEVITRTWTATDASGNAASADQTITVRDTTPPALTPPADVTATATGPLTVVAIGTATATDLYGPVTIANDAPAAYPPGTTEVTWTATDAHGNESTAVQRVTVQYQFGGFQAPVEAGGVYKLGRTIPVKVAVNLADGSPAADAVVTLWLQQLSDGDPVGDPIEVTSSSAADSGNTFRYVNGMFIYNLDTGVATKGTYRLVVMVDDGASYWIDIGFK